MTKDNLIKEAFQVFEELSQTNSKNRKIEILTAHKSNEYLKEMLKFACDPFLLYGIKKLPELTKRSSKKPTYKKYMEFKELLTQLSERTLTGNAAREAVKDFLESCGVDEVFWYSQIITKDLEIGAEARTINKVFKNLIPQFNVALANTFKKASSVPSKVIIEDKIDGIRCIAIKYSKDKVVLYSRNGKELFGFSKLINEIKKIPKDGIVLDGELTSGKSFNDVSSIRGRKINDKDAVYNIFDLIDLESFKKGVDKTPILKRKEKLVKTVTPNNILRIVEYSGPVDSEDTEQINKYFEDALARGFEGIMLKGSNSIYECKRTNNWLKLKPEETYDGKIIDFQEGTGMFEGTLGAIIVEFNGNLVKVGSGFTIEERDEIWANREKLLGKTIEFKGQEITENKRGTNSVRFPVFVRFRDDK